jgi:hypothetical protein
VCELVLAYFCISMHITNLEDTRYIEETLSRRNLLPLHFSEKKMWLLWSTLSKQQSSGVR